METAVTSIATDDATGEREGASERFGRRLALGLLVLELVWLSAIGYGVSELLQ
jgi:hypothetical protein